MNRRLLPIVGAGLALAAGALWYLFNASGGSPEKKAPPPVPVVTAKAELRDVALTLELAGRTEALESVSLRARVDGQVEAVPFAEGHHVARGDVLVRLDAADFAARRAQAEANLARDQAQAVKADADLQRAQSLKAKGFIADAGVDLARATLESAQATVGADRAALDLARLQVDYTVIRAPFDGIVGARLVFSGTAVKANDTILAVVNRVRPLFVTFNVPEKYLPRLKAEMKVKGGAVTVGVPGETARFTGELRFVDNAVDTGTGTIQVKAQLANEDEKLSSGQFVDVSLPLETLTQAITVPAEAIQQGPDGSFVYVVAEDGSAQLRKVTVTATQAQRATIGQGLAAGEPVVIEGQLRLVPGSPTRPANAKPPAAAPAPAAK